MKPIKEMNQLERLQHLKSKFKGQEEKLKNPVHSIWLKKLEILEQNPQYIDKLKHFIENEVYATSRDDIIFYVEVGRLERD